MSHRVQEGEGGGKTGRKEMKRKKGKKGEEGEREWGEKEEVSSYVLVLHYYNEMSDTGYLQSKEKFILARGSEGSSPRSSRPFALGLWQGQYRSTHQSKQAHHEPGSRENLRVWGPTIPSKTHPQ